MYLVKNKRVLKYVFLCVAILFAINISTTDWENSSSLEWKIELHSQVLSQPVVSGDWVFLQTEDEILAIDFLTGRTIWSKPYKSNSVQFDRNFINESNNLLLISSGENPILAISASSGIQEWETKSSDRPVERVIVYKNTVYEARFSSYMTSYDLNSGNINWRREIPSRTSIYLFAYDDKLYLGTNKSVIIYNALDGELINEYELGGLIGEMEFNDNILYISYVDSNNCSYAAFDFDIKTLIWCAPLSREIEMSEVSDIYIEDRYVLISGDKLIALNKNSGDVEWISNVYDSLSLIATASNQIYVQGKTKIYRISITDGRGEVYYSYPINYYFSWVTQSGVNPTVFGNYILIVKEKSLYKYNLNSQ